MRIKSLFAVLCLYNVIFSQIDGNSLEEGLKYYGWGNPNGHVLVDLWTYENDSTFRFILRDDIWIDEIKGVFQRHNDSLYFYKKSLLNLKEAINEPFVIESNVKAILPKGVYYTVSSTDGSALEGYSFLMNDSIADKKEILLTKNDWVFKYQVKDKTANRYDFIIPFNFYDIVGEGYTTFGVENENGDLVFGKYTLKKEIVPSYDEKKKYKLFKKKKR